MISVEMAKDLCEKHFPNGPERLARELEIGVHESPLTGCDGWVLSGPAGVVIRLNERAAPARRRFTLAHELGHLLLGIPTTVGESIYESLKSNSDEERRVNDLAAELLLPASIVRQQLSSLPVIAAQLRKLAKLAKVSELAAAIRVANLAREIGLANASVAFFKDEQFEWQWSKSLKMSSTTAENLLAEAVKSAPQPVRIPQGEKIIVASMIENPGLGSATVFVQLLPEEVGKQPSSVERRHELEAFLFGDDNQFRMQLQGVFGAFRARCAGLPIEMAVSEFFDSKGERWVGTRRTRLQSPKGREYVRLRLMEWCD